jgi:hypothetical protein
MTSLLRCSAFTALLVLLVSAWAGTSVRAQQPPPPSSFRPYSPAVPQPQTLTNTQGAMPNYQVVNPTPQNPNPYSGQPGFVPYGGVVQTPMNGYLTGAADVTNANAQYQLTIQQARLQREIARQAASDTRMKISQERRYEAAQQPTPEDIRQQEIVANLNRAMNNPPLIEIWSGNALNAILMALQQAQSQGLRGPNVPLAPDLLSHINVTTGVTTAGSGMLKSLNNFNWPMVLRTDSFKNGRENIEKLARQAVQQAMSGPVDVDTFNSLNDAVSKMRQEVVNRVDDLSPDQYIQGTRFLRELGDSFRTLNDPNVANYLNGKFRAQGNNVAELVANMSTNGLRFSAAVSGQEPFYTALHQSMVTYNVQLGMLANR